MVLSVILTIDLSVKLLLLSRREYAENIEFSKIGREKTHGSEQENCFRQALAPGNRRS